jgi:hypothetical protein
MRVQYLRKGAIVKTALRLTIAALGLAIFNISLQAEDYTYTTNNGTITITRYTGPGSDVAIPDKINGLPVTGIGAYAFDGCINLTSITIGNGVTSIGEGAFYYCARLTTVTVGNSLTNIGAWAFNLCPILKGVHFKGNAPGLGINIFYGAENVIVYYLPSTTGWGVIFGGRPTAQWRLPYPVILTSSPSFGIQTNAFGFIIFWATNIPVVVEASTTLTNPTWSSLQTNTLVNGSSYFNDPKWTNYPSRFYRIRSL